MAPKTLLLVGVLLACLAVLVFMIVRSIGRHTSPQAAEIKSEQIAQQTATAAQHQGPPPPGATLPDERIDFIPRLSDRPWTAPAYDGLRQVARMPSISGAICINGVCECYHGKERLMEISSDACQHWAAYRPFNPYAPEPDNKPETRSQTPGESTPPASDTQSNGSGMLS